MLRSRRPPSGFPWVRFGNSLARLRNQVDLDEVTGGPRDTLAATVAPVRVGLWVRDGADGRA